MSRVIHQTYASHAQEYLDGFHSEVVKEVQKAVSENDVVVVGMSINNAVKRVRKALDKEGIPYTYLEYGGYLSKWKERLAVKMWSGWPTYPQVFVKGHLMGGNQRTRMALADGSFQKILRGESSEERSD